MSEELSFTLSTGQDQTLFQAYGLNREIIPENGTAQGPVESLEISPPCPTSATPHGVAYMAFAQNTRAEVRLQGGGDISGALSASTGTQQTTYVSGKTADGYVVRRLTPVECERLQGFPDNYTRIPYRGKPAAECPDAPRYKALGNSFCVPVVRWIFERIDAAERGTLGKDGRRYG